MPLRADLGHSQSGMIRADRLHSDSRREGDGGSAWGYNGGLRQPRLSFLWRAWRIVNPAALEETQHRGTKQSRYAAKGHDRNSWDREGGRTTKDAYSVESTTTDEHDDSCAEREDVREPTAAFLRPRELFFLKAFRHRVTPWAVRAPLTRRLEWAGVAWKIDAAGDAEVGNQNGLAGGKPDAKPRRKMKNFHVESTDLELQIEWESAVMAKHFIVWVISQTYYSQLRFEQWFTSYWGGSVALTWENDH